MKPTPIQAYDMLARFVEFHWTLKGWFVVYDPRAEQELLRAFQQAFLLDREATRKALAKVGEYGQGKRAFWEPKGPFFSDPREVGEVFCKQLK